MIVPPTDDEAGRRQALARYAILDTPPEAAFDDLVRLASLACGTPIAVVSLIDSDRQWFKARIGIEAAETPREVSFCDHAIRQPDRLMVVPDATLDDRFATNPLVVGGPKIRSYAGAPLVTSEGIALGTLCVIDGRPRDFTAEQAEVLRALGRQVVAQLELRLRVVELQGMVGELRRSEACLRAETSRREAILEAALDAVVTIDQEGSILEYNAAAERTFGYARDEVLGRLMVELLIPPEARDLHRLGIARDMSTGEGPILGRRIEVDAMRKGGATFPTEMAIAVTRDNGPPSFTAYFRDLTETKRAAEALRVSEERFTLAARGTDDGIWDWDVRTGELYLAPRFLELLDLSVEEFEPTLAGWEALLHPEDHDRVMAAIVEHLERRSPYVIEYRLRTGGGEYRWFLARGQAVWGPAGEAVRMAGSLGDIGERRRAEEALRRSDAEARKLALVASRTDNAVILTDATGLIDWVNDGFTRITGYTLEEVAGRSPGSFLQGPESDPAVTAYMRAQVRRGEGFKTEVINYAKSGRKYWLAIEVQPIYGDDGKLLHFMAIESDITDRKRFEERLRLLEAAVEHANDAIIITEAEPVEKPGPRIVYVNPAFTRTTGYDAAEVLGQTPRLLQGIGTDRATLALLRSRLKAWKTVQVELLNYRKDGSEFWVELNIRPVADARGWYTHWVSIQRDVTDRKQAEQDQRRRSEAELQESRQRLRTVVDGAPVILFALDRGGNFTLSEGCGLGALGLGPGELVGRPASGIFAGAGDPQGALHRALAGETTAEVAEIRGRAFDCRYTPLRGEDGVPIGLAGVATDVTDLRRAEAKYRDIFENAAEGIFQSTPDGQFISANPALARILGYDSPEGLIGGLADIPNQAYVDPARRDDFIRAIEAGGAVADFESLARRRDGSVIWIAERARAVRDAGGRPLYFEGTVEDITGRKAAEERIREQAALLDVTQDAIVVRGLDDRVLHWNRGAERLYGWTAAEAIGRDADELLATRPGLLLEEARRATLADGSWAGELSQSARDGREVVVQGRWSLDRDGLGRARSILEVNTDVTETKQLEAQFFRAQRMEALGRLASGVSHDLNNVLTPITMAVDLLQMRAVDPASRAMLATLRQNADRGAAMVKQILAFARGVEGRRVLLEVGPLIGEVERMLRPTLPKSIAIRVECPAGARLVRADETQLCQVMMNLCVNARDAMPDGGTLCISAVDVTLDERLARLLHPDARPGPHVHIAVADTGSGIAPEILDKIFDPFFTTKPLGQSTGLGLSTVLGIVKGHGGFVKVRSDAGRGTRFGIYLPTPEISREGPTAPHGPELPGGAGQLILVVDDEAPILAIARNVLEAHGYRALTACHGGEALDLFDRHPGEIAAVITDMMMPVMDGPNTIRALVRIDPKVRIIATSGVEDVRPTDPSPEAVKAFLPKPYSASAILGTLREVLATA